MIITAYTVGAFQENSYLVVDETTNVCVLIDPGAEGERLIAAVEESGATLEAIWVTHGHLDHVGAIAAVTRRWDVPVWLHALDRRLYDASGWQAKNYGVPFEDPPPPDRDIADGDVMRVGSLAFDVMHAPGHAPGHVVLHGHGTAFVGDCLFAGSIGRTDLPFSDPAALAQSLVRIATLPDATRVLSGHGPETTIGVEKRTNPFLSGLAIIPGSRR